MIEGRNKNLFISLKNLLNLISTTRLEKPKKSYILYFVFFNFIKIKFKYENLSSIRNNIYSAPSLI